MKSDERRKSIVNLLLSENRPVSGSELSEKYGVSRQIIVRDISILKEQGNDIFATNAGYMIRSSPFKERVFKVLHTTNQTEDELQTIVDLGGTIADVYVWHKAYGKMEAKLNISSRSQIDQFIESVRSGKSVELMHITGGYHYHTVRAASEGILDKIESALNIPRAVSVFLETPRKGQHPRNRLRTKLFTRTAPTRIIRK